MTKIALVTGGTRGIGLGIARKLADEGWDLALMGMRPEEDLTETFAELHGRGVRAIYCRGNVAEPADHEAALAKIRAEFGALHLLVNNAGVAPKVRADVLDMSMESYDRVMGINLRGPFFLTQACARWMVEQKRADADFAGYIVNVSSISATVASVSRGEYCLSKAGVSMATQLWAARLGECGIPVYEVRPGVIMTDMTSVVKEKYDKLIGEGLCVQRRWGYPEDVGKAVAMLARGDLAYSTGQVLMVDGGLTIPRL
jgi:NAD(P)-dependent dehydrogenase (short-subunit alcohol dehydrogenase family)